MTSQAVDALQKIHVQVEKVIDGMEQSDWELQSLCEGWRVQEVFAHMSSNMKEAVNQSYNLANHGDVVLLSPACASFNLFDNYEDRGFQFKNEVRKLYDLQFGESDE